MGDYFEVENSTGRLFLGAGGFDDGALLAINSTTHGFLLPRMTTAQRNAIDGGTPTAGLVIFNTTDQELNVYNGMGWVPIGSTAFPLLAPFGSAGAPSYSFTGDPDTGMYRVGADDIGFTAGNGLRLDISSTKVTSTVPMRLPDTGSAAAPQLQIGASNNGFYTGISNRLAISCGGSAVAQILSTSFQLLTGVQLVVGGGADTNQVLFDHGGIGNITLSAPAAASGRTYTIPDSGTPTADFMMTNGNQTVNKTLTWNTGFLYTNLGSVSAPGLALNGTDKTSGFTGGSGGHNIVMVANSQNALEADGDANTIVVGSFNMGIGGSPVTNGLLTLSSTTKAFVPPRMTSTQRDAITSPTAGMMVYNTSSNQVSFYDGSTWNNLAAGGVSYPLLAPNGSAGAPSYSFSSDPNTGIYWNGPDAISISANGTRYFTVSNTNSFIETIFGVTAGSAAAPALYFGSDQDSGLYSVADNNLGFTTSGTQRLTLTTTALNFVVDCVPTTDLTRDNGKSSQRWLNIWGQTIHSGDIELENKWRITEGEKIGHPEEGVMLLSPSGKKYKIHMTEVE